MIAPVTHPKKVLITIRISRTQNVLLNAVQEVRGDETRSDTMREALSAFLRLYIKPGHTQPPGPPDHEEVE
jgi:hypothetical protein